MVQYDAKMQNNEGADWRIKEALMFSIGTLKSAIGKQ